MTDFDPVSSFEEILTKASDLVKATDVGYVLNLSLKVSFAGTMLDAPQLLDVVEMASDFQSLNCPPHLYLNHGSYIGEEGVNHVINELTNKNTSNRAVISLINEGDIVGSGDSPIPSFMIVQFSIENESVLYVTTYFRALEVAKFLRVNMEELRMLCRRVVPVGRTIRAVNLHLFAFRAYINENINTLKIPILERMGPVAITRTMLSAPVSMAKLVLEKAQFTTVVDDSDLGTMEKVLSEFTGPSNPLHPILQSRFFSSCLNKAATAARELKRLRVVGSHLPELAVADQRYADALKVLAREFEKCV